MPDRRRRAFVLLMLVAGVIFGLSAFHVPRTTDVVSANVASWKIATTGTPWLDLPHDDEALPDRWTTDDLFTTTNADNGEEVIARSAGPIAAAVPAYLVQKVLTGGSNDDSVSFMPASLTAALLAVIALLLLAGSIPRSVPLPVTVAGAAALAFTTPYWTVIGSTLWPHTVTAVGIGGMAWAAHRERWWLVGMFGGVALLGRLHLALTVAVLGIVVAYARRRPGIALKIAATSIPAIGLLALWGHWFYGSWSPTTGYAAGDLAAWPATRTWWEQLGDLAGVFVSPGYGVLVWTPVLLLLGPAVVRSWSSAPDWTRGLALGGLAYLLVQVYLNPYHGGNGFWGYRLPLEALCCAFPLLMVSLHRMGARARAWLTPVLGYQLGTIALGAALGLGLVQKTASWGWTHYTIATTASISAPVVVVVIGLGLVTAYLARGWLREALAGADDGEDAHVVRTG
ncbi:hypothetical protein [Pimelobacter simplex]|uniref:hypothetical protein n=1 Tax=Nocardioides simplex TaxID=2045 RepID=UPI00214F6B31|nr:hypothetical protein [Pimelobacter simplex]UUW87529.1 hypothetical protein M0M43_17480 [Pimelobacter simplex]UUW97035.1 hypothetical protein M0M48_06130 [Pimelobacter simplex]